MELPRILRGRGILELCLAQSSYHPAQRRRYRTQYSRAFDPIPDRLNFVSRLQRRRSHSCRSALYHSQTNQPLSGIGGRIVSPGLCDVVASLGDSYARRVTLFGHYSLPSGLRNGSITGSVEGNNGGNFRRLLRRTSVLRIGRNRLRVVVALIELYSAGTGYLWRNRIRLVRALRLRLSHFPQLQQNRERLRLRFADGSVRVGS